MASAIMVIMITQIKCSAFTRIFWPFYSVLIRNIIKCRGDVATVFICDPVLTHVRCYRNINDGDSENEINLAVPNTN